MTTIDMSQFYQVFFEESEEHLAAMEALLLELDIDNPEPEQLNAIFRAAHSIKGSSGTFGFTDLTDVTHILETLLDRLRKNEIKLRSDMVDAFLEAGDVLKTMLAGHRGDGGADPQAMEAVCARLKQLAGNPQPAPVATPAAASAATPPAPAAPAAVADSGGHRSYDIEFVPTAHAAADAAIISGLLDELRGYGELQIIVRPDPAGDGAGFWHLRLKTDQAAERFGDSIDFIAEQDAWRISETVSAALEDAGGAFGFFPSAAGSPVVDDRFGLFEDMPPPVATESASPAEAEAYGFFEPLPETPGAAASPAPEPGDGCGYGFFVPLDATPSPAPAAAPVPEDGDGFGFFAPLPAPPVVPERAAAPQRADTAPQLVAAGPAKPARAEAGAVPVPAAKAVKAAPAATAAETSSIRVGVEKVDQLINLVGELVITQAMLLQCAEQMHGSVPERLAQGLAQLERNTRDLQESVMSIRMLPISFVFSRFPRVVRDLSSKLGKLVELKMSGETTELDKGLIEKIADPLTHLIRNSLDHGIEMPDRRAAAGKNPTGTITLRAAHQGGNIVIEVGDDGGGLSRPKILSKARERGFQVSDQMSDAEVWMLIFEAGFSTADVVTDVSGRGVGMDVVRRNIQAMGGRVEIESMTGIGTRMTVRLPLTLAILDGMSVAVGDQIYILPLSYVIESVQPDLRDVKTLSNQARVIRVRGEYLPVIVLHEIFGIKPAAANLTQGIMVILDADGTRAALFVDALVGQHQVVIKSLENNFRRVAGISGATIMGDGHVALILDISALAAMAKSAQMAAA
ncbi:MAG: chemotaxis protein CheW [Betaproteobacteria bacterium]|nr:chemotaxis protein CheW [Betaproteobacteria bacterium]